MGERRPSVISKRAEVRKKQHNVSAMTPVDSTTPSPSQQLIPPPPTQDLNHFLVGVGYIGLAAFVYNNAKRFSHTELTTICVGSVAVGWGLYDLGRMNGIFQGASLALQKFKGSPKNLEIKAQNANEDDWKGEFRGQEYTDLQPVDKISWLKKEEKRVRQMQKEEQLECGKAYIAKEEAYGVYERLGGYGGPDWHRYNAADTKCQDMYNNYEKHEKRLGQIRREIKELSDEM